MSVSAHRRSSGELVVQFIRLDGKLMILNVMMRNVHICTITTRTWQNFITGPVALLSHPLFTAIDHELAVRQPSFLK